MTVTAITLAGTDDDGTIDFFKLTSLPLTGALYIDAGLTTEMLVDTDYAATAGELIAYYLSPPTPGNNLFNYLAKDNSGEYSVSEAVVTITVEAASLFEDYSAAVWQGSINYALSNADLTITATEQANFTRGQTIQAITGIIYIEIYAVGFAGAASEVGIKPLASANTANDATTPSGAVGHEIPTGEGYAYYGISYNALTGAYEIRKNNVVVNSGVAIMTNPVIYFQGGQYNTVGQATINAGTSAFQYAPVQV